jgi:hypothetical protein
MQTITTPVVRQAQAALHEMSADEKTRIRLLEEEMYERDRISGLARALKEGREEIALNLIRDTGMSDARIAGLSNLSVQEVARLREQP